MAKIARSARGEIVNFDILAIRLQMANAPAPVEVSARREYIDNKESGRPIKEDSILRPITAGGDMGDEFDNPNLDDE